MATTRMDRNFAGSEYDRQVSDGVNQIIRSNNPHRLILNREYNEQQIFAEKEFDNYDKFMDNGFQLVPNPEINLWRIGMSKFEATVKKWIAGDKQGVFPDDRYTYFPMVRGRRIRNLTGTDQIEIVDVGGFGSRDISYQNWTRVPYGCGEYDASIEFMGAFNGIMEQAASRERADRDKRKASDERSRRIAESNRKREREIEEEADRDRQIENHSKNHELRMLNARERATKSREKREEKRKKDQLRLEAELLAADIALGIKNSDGTPVEHRQVPIKSPESMAYHQEADKEDFAKDVEAMRNPGGMDVLRQRQASNHRSKVSSVRGRPATRRSATTDFGDLVEDTLDTILTVAAVDTAFDVIGDMCNGLFD